MTWFLLGIGLLALRTLWGAGLAMLLLPPRMRRYWLVYAPLAGAALQMLAVWAGAYLDLPGTDSYAWAALALPVGLLGWALARSGWRGFLDDLKGVSKFSGAIAAMLLALAALLLPASQKSASPTTISLGSCDLGSYAAGAEAFKKYAASDRRGFLGQAGPNQGLEGVGFHGLWMDYDHFGPAALLAMSASYAGKDVFKIGTIETATYWAMLLPMAFWIARSFFRLGKLGATFAALVLAVCPISQYVVHHGMLGQILASGALCLIWWASARIIESAGRGVDWRYVGWAVVGNALLIGSYAFFLPLAYAPIVAYAALRTALDGKGLGRDAWRNRIHRLARWGKLMGIALLVSGGLYFSRIAALPYLYLDLSGQAYGWNIPTFNLMGFIGWFENPELVAGSTAMSRLAALGLGAALVCGLWLKLLGRRWLAAAGALLVGSVGLYWVFAAGLLNEGSVNSYQAFKVIAVSYPLVLLAICGGFRLFAARDTMWRVAAFGLGVSLLWVNGFATSRIAKRVTRAPLMVDSQLGGVRRIQDLEQVQSVNVLFPQVWPRLWSSGFLLAKAQYYDAASYEGRPKRPLEGEWDLGYETIMAIPAAEEDIVWINPMYHLARRAQAKKISAEFDERWHPEDTIHQHRWRWSDGRAGVRLTNHTGADLPVAFRLSGSRSLVGEIAVELNGSEYFRGQCSELPGSVAAFDAVLMPGVNVFEVDPLSGAWMTDGDGRELGFALYRLDIQLPKGVTGL